MLEHVPRGLGEAPSTVKAGLDRTAAVPASPGRGALVEAMKGHVVAKGLLTGTYGRV